MNAELLSPKLRMRAMKVAARIVGPQDAEDMVQNAYVSALSTRCDFRGECQAFTWFHRIVMNHCLMHLRRAKRRKEDLVEEMPEPEAKEVAVDMLIHLEERRDRILRAINALPGEAKGAVLMQFHNPELSIAEIASFRGKTFDAEKSNLHRARKRLAKTLEGEFAA